jgi:hypothetical protein
MLVMVVTDRFVAHPSEEIPFIAMVLNLPDGTPVARNVNRPRVHANLATTTWDRCATDNVAEIVYTAPTSGLFQIGSGYFVDHVKRSFFNDDNPLNTHNNAPWNDHATSPNVTGAGTTYFHEDPHAQFIHQWDFGPPEPLAGGVPAAGYYRLTVDMITSDPILPEAELSALRELKVRL